jgi:hypothetical protein
MFDWADSVDVQGEALLLCGLTAQLQGGKTSNNQSINRCGLQ